MPICNECGFEEEDSCGWVIGYRKKGKPARFCSLFCGLIWERHQSSRANTIFDMYSRNANLENAIELYKDINLTTR